MKSSWVLISLDGNCDKRLIVAPVNPARGSSLNAWIAIVVAETIRETPICHARLLVSGPV
jgi:hypothetical protein